MMKDERLDRLRTELEGWRAKLDHLRVQANLGGKEARDKLAEFEKRLTPAIRDAKRQVNEALEDGTDEARALGRGLLAGWDELRRTHRELSREARAEREATRRGRRD